jgi:hypothetical protein
MNNKENKEQKQKNKDNEELRTKNEEPATAELGTR